MSSECGPWRSCDFHQYRSWLRKVNSAPSSAAPPDKEKQKTRKPRRRPMPGEYQLTFRHHSDPAEYERDYLTQVTHARCRAANPSASLLATELTLVRPAAPGADERQTAPPPQTAPKVPTPRSGPQLSSARPLQVTASTPDLSAGSASPPAQPASSPDLCHLPKIIVGAQPPRRLPLSPASVTSPATAAAAATAASAAAAAAAAAARKPAAQSAPRPGGQREETDQSAAVLRPRRQPPRQASTPHMVTLDLPTPQDSGCVAQARRNGYKPRGLTKIQFASSVPENLTIIVGRKLEISLSGAKRGHQRGRGFR